MWKEDRVDSAECGWYVTPPWTIGFCTNVIIVTMAVTFCCKHVLFMLYPFFRVIPLRLNFICRRFGTLFHLHRQVSVKYDWIWQTLEYLYPPSYSFRLLWSQTFSRVFTPTFLKSRHTSYLPVYEDGTECSETSAYKIQTQGNHPEESIQHSEHGESLKSCAP